MLIQAFTSKLALEAFNVCILLWLARLDESQLQLVAVSPFVEHLANEFRSIVYCY